MVLSFRGKILFFYVRRKNYFFSGKTHILFCTWISVMFHNIEECAQWTISMLNPVLSVWVYGFSHCVQACTSPPTMFTHLVAKIAKNTLNSCWNRYVKPQKCIMYTFDRLHILVHVIAYYKISSLYNFNEYYNNHNIVIWNLPLTKCFLCIVLHNIYFT